LVFDIFSEPAKSIRNSLLTFACAVYEWVWVRVSKKIICEREETAFMFVAFVVLFRWPKLINLYSSALSLMNASVRCSTYVPVRLFSRIFKSLLLVSSKSLIFYM
jgi:hypothetical protein